MRVRVSLLVVLASVWFAAPAFAQQGTITGVAQDETKAALPGVNGDHQTVSGPDLWVLFNHDDVNRAGASRDFVTWLTSKEIDPKWNLSVGNLPLRSSEKDTPEFANYIKEYPGGQKFFDNLANAKQARPTLPGYEVLSRNVGDAIAKVLQGQAQPKEALDEAAKKSATAVSN